MGSTVRMDHLATWNEVCEALAFSSLEDSQLCTSCDEEHGAENDFDSSLGFLDEELAWLAFASKVQNGRLN